MRRVPARVLAGSGVYRGDRCMPHVRLLLYVLRALRKPPLEQPNSRLRESVARSGVEFDAHNADIIVRMGGGAGVNTNHPPRSFE